MAQADLAAQVTELARVMAQADLAAQVTELVQVMAQADLAAQVKEVSERDKLDMASAVFKVHMAERVLVLPLEQDIILRHSV